MAADSPRHPQAAILLGFLGVMACSAVLGVLATDELRQLASLRPILIGFGLLAISFIGDTSRFGASRRLLWVSAGALGVGAAMPVLNAPMSGLAVVGLVSAALMWFAEGRQARAID